LVTPFGSDEYFVKCPDVESVRTLLIVRPAWALSCWCKTDRKEVIPIEANRKLLGYSFRVSRGRVVKRRVARKALAAMKERVRIITRRTRGRSTGQVVQELRRAAPSIGSCAAEVSRMWAFAG